VAGVRSRIVARRPAIARRAILQLSPPGVPVIGSASVGGGVIWGVAVAPRTLPSGVGVGVGVGVG
jgi:hypothetical protein